MRKGLLIGTVGMLALGGAGYAIVSSFVAPAVWARDTMRDSSMMLAEFGPDSGPAQLGEKLHLTQAQRNEIKTIVAAEKPQVGPIVRELGSTFKRVQSMTDDGTASPDQVHAMVDK